MPSQAFSSSVIAKDSRYIQACPIGCSAKLTVTPIVLPEGALLECAECGQLVSQATAARYAETMNAFDAPGFNQPAARELVRRRRVAQRRLRQMAHLLECPANRVRLLDVGCSRGHFLSAALELGVCAEGVEPAPNIAAAARASGLRVQTGLLQDIRFASGSFDAVTLFEVIEHLRDPLLLVSECRRVLRAGGILCLSTGNAASWTVRAMGARWDYFDMDKDGGHISFFNPRSIALLAQRCDFAVSKIETSRVRFTEKNHTSRVLHALAKPAAEFLSFPAKLALRGHDMLAYLRAK